MSILIKGMEMPKRGMVVNIYADGRVTNHFDEFGKTIGKAVPIPPHGDLIDAFAFRREMDDHYPFDKFTQSKHGEADAAKSTILRMLAKAPTIIEAEE